VLYDNLNLHHVMHVCKQCLEEPASVYSCRLSANRAGLLLLILLSAAVCACGVKSGTLPVRRACPETLDLNMLVSRAYASAVRTSDADVAGAGGMPAYLQALLADGRISIGLGIGTEDLGMICLPPDETEHRFSATVRLQGMDAGVDVRLILTRDDFRAALAECEIIFITSHSRFGAGPVFLHDGKDKPFRMQTTSGYEIVMPQSEVGGYGGEIVRTFRNEVRKKDYTVFAPDSTELDASRPLPGYQMIVFSTCSSRRHFRDDIARFRRPYPTTAIFTRRSCLMDTSMRVFIRLLYGVFAAQPVEEVVDGLNAEYTAVAWQHVREHTPPWQVIDKLYTLGLHTLPD
jgi:hypothetical protein